MVIKAENTIDFDDINQLNKSHMSAVKIMLWVFMSAIAVILVISVISHNTGRNFAYCIAGLLWCAFVYLYMFALNPRMTYRVFRKKYGDSPVNFMLNEKSMGITIENQDGSWDIRKNYRDMFKFTETEDYFFIHVKRNEAYILKKSGITQGTAEDIRNTVSKEMGNRFVVKIKRKNNKNV